MFGLTEGMSYYVCQRYVNMGLGINGLYKLVSQEMGEPPLGGGVFIFFGKSRQSVKILRWDTDGFMLYHKRLEAYSAHYRRKRLVGHFVRLLRCVKEGKLKRATLKPLVVKHEPVGVPPEYLHRLSRLTEKDKNPTSERRLAHLL